MPLSRSILDAPQDTIANAKCPEGTSASMEQIEADRIIERNWEHVKRIVAERDKGRCRMCGKRCRYGASNLRERGDPHHIVFQSAGGDDSTANVLLMCREHHDMCHKARRFWLSGNADDRDELGHGMVKVERQVEGGFETVGWI